MATVSAAPANARSERILRRSTTASSASATISTATDPTTSCAEVRMRNARLFDWACSVLDWRLSLPVYHQDMVSACAESASVTPTTRAVPATAPWMSPPASPRTGSYATVAGHVNVESANAPTPNSRVKPARSVPPAPVSASSTSECLPVKGWFSLSCLTNGCD